MRPFVAKGPLALYKVAFFYFQSSLALHCLHRPIACDMVVLGMHQSIRTTLSVDSRVLTAITPLVLVYEDVSRMDFGVEESFLAKVRPTEVERILLNK